MTGNLKERCLKAFVEGVAGALVPETIIILNNLDKITSWQTFLAVLVPVVGGALGAGISAVWNILETKLKNDATK